MDIAEKRVYDASAGRTRLAVATDQGLAVVGISADVIGEFGLALRAPVRDVVAAGEGRLLVATDDDLLLVALGEDGVAETADTASAGAGPTAAVTIADDAVIAAGSDGTVRRTSLSTVLDRASTESKDATAAKSTQRSKAESDADVAEDSNADPEAESNTADDAAWAGLGEVTVRNADGSLLATPDGVYRVGASSIEYVGLEDVRDVAVPSGDVAVGPVAATGDGLFRLGPGWIEEHSGEFDLVSVVDRTDASAAEAGTGAVQRPTGVVQPQPSAYAGADGELLARTDGEWSAVEWPAGSPAADVAYDQHARSTYAVAADGTVLADAGDGWRTRSIGLRDVAACTVVE